MNVGTLLETVYTTLDFGHLIASAIEKNHLRRKSKPVHQAPVCSSLASRGLQVRCGLIRVFGSGEMCLAINFLNFTKEIV
jgi:hypothetical protein